ncbi:MAG: DUF1015 domain-containing protein [Eubacteriales bacterium]|nr:DUF1015 domain-containing protein [Eubacteriales bacterium]
MPDPSSPSTSSLCPALHLPNLVLPDESIDLRRWAVIACDQHTTDPAYWQQVEQVVEDAPSSYHMILPEIYLEQPDDLPVSHRISRINRYMETISGEQKLRTLPPGWMLIDRTTAWHSHRLGLVIAIDLEHYDFTPGSSALIRASEGTVVERIPPRLAVRSDALYELPHVQLLFDDPGHTVIEPVYDALKHNQPFYETDLMLGGGHIRGWHVTADQALTRQMLTALGGLDRLHRDGLLFAVGDGNHSLATAKAHWDEIKDQVADDHPARFALVELINIYDDGIEFEPIHRVISGLDIHQLADSARRFFAQQQVRIQPLRTLSGELALPACPAGENRMTLVGQTAGYDLRLLAPQSALSTASAQAWLDHLLTEETVQIDYVHGLDAISRLARQGQCGIVLPDMSKQSFFDSIVQDGVLPRKTFSIGAAAEKRYYIEGRRIR